MFLYFYGNLQGLSKNPSPEAQKWVKLAERYYQYLELIPAQFDKNGNLIRLPEKGSLMEQDYISMKIK